MRVEMLRSAAEVAALGPEWARLHGRSSAATPYNHPAWIAAWWRERAASGLSWHCAVGRNGQGSLIAVLPLVRCPDGAVRYAGHDLHDVAAALTEERHLHQLWREAVARLGTLGVQRIDLPTLDEADRVTLSGVGGDLILTVPSTDPGARIQLPESWEAYLGCLSTSRRKRMRAERRALDSEYAWRFEVVSGHETAEALDEFWALREQSWRVRGRYAELAEHTRGCAMRSFLTGLAAQGAASGLVSVARLVGDRHLIGSAVLLYAARCAWYALCAFSPAFSRFGPGRLLLAECVRTSIARGLDCLELGRGVEEYKFALGAVRYELPNAVLTLPPS